MVVSASFVHEMSNKDADNSQYAIFLIIIYRCNHRGEFLNSFFQLAFHQVACQDIELDLYCHARLARGLIDRHQLYPQVERQWRVWRTELDSLARLTLDYFQCHLAYRIYGYRHAVGVKSQGFHLVTRNSHVVRIEVEDTALELPTLRAPKHISLEIDVQVFFSRAWAIA